MMKFDVLTHMGDERVLEASHDIAHCTNASRVLSATTEFHVWNQWGYVLKLKTISLKGTSSARNTPTERF